MGYVTPFDQWYEDLHTICGQYHGVPQRHQRNVQGKIGVHAFDRLDVADVSGDVARIERDAAGIRRDEAEHIFFLIGMSGRVNVNHNGAHSQLQPGECILLDSTKEGVLHMAHPDSRILSVHLPRQTFLGERGPGLRVGRKTAAANRVLPDLTRHFFRFFTEVGASPLEPVPSSAPEPVRRRSASADLLFDMIHLAFTRPETGIAGLQATNAADRYELALDLIDRHLTGEYLSLAWLAARLGLSERQLQRVFQENGTSFIELLRTKRYRYVTEHLKHSDRAHGRIADFAYGAGFRDLSNFNRGFRARFGMSPRDYHRLISGRVGAQPV